ncbi:MAG TPA: glycosyltransferase [Bryobacteraceae bacterium]|jgi:glycosyltransferase involved in cell wall biosynthesis|nr:glycosyltransferase [Bryobacteraceae bacterium]
MKRIRVMHILPDLVPYGLERIVANLALLGDRDRFEPIVTSLYGYVPGSLAGDFERAGVRVFHLDKRRGFDPRMITRLARAVRQVKPEILHTHNYVLRYVLPAAALGGSPRIVHTVHNLADRETDRIGVWIQKRAFAGRVQPVAISEECAASFERVYGRGAPIIRNGITVEKYQRPSVSRLEWRRVHGFAMQDLLITCVARFDPQKNHRTLIEAFARVAREIPAAKLVLAGSGRLQEAAGRQVRQLGLEPRVFFLGQRGDIADILGASDIFALASLWEGNPLSVMEAMAAGLPIAATRVGAIPELAEHETHGLLAAAGDGVALAEAMLGLARHADRRRHLGRAAAERARQRFDHRGMVAAYEDLYRQVLGAPAKESEVTYR